jgi:hypothetical protein
MQEMIYVGSRFADLRPRINDFCKDYFNDFTENKHTWVKKDGYFHRLIAALNAGSYLRANAKRQNNTELEQSYNAKMKEYKSEQIRLLRRKRW